MSSDSAPKGPSFRDLALPGPIIQVLDELGYELPSPIQAQTIPLLLEGRDVLGQAQTGTGKTAAFALPALSRTDLSQQVPQTLVLAPTRELAIQVAEAFQRYAAGLKGFHVLPVYGGQSYQPQLKGLRRGAHVIVGTPGRVVDHIKRGTLKLDTIRMLVLDEADEMLRMGFIDDIEWVIQQTPENRQVALFSATMPSPIRRVARTYLKSPAEIHIQAPTTTATRIRQRYWLVSGASKLDGLTRILEAEPFEAMLIFVRTKLATVELAEKLEARGFSAAALNGDMDQKQRERTVARIKSGTLDIVVATDVAARGLDVDRISHVLNYDIPTDTESYVHRIGRTGRAGRSGEAILFVAPRERRLLRAIENATRQSVSIMALPTDLAIQDKKVQKLERSILDLLGNASAKGEIGHLQAMIEQVADKHALPIAQVAGALAYQLQPPGTTRSSAPAGTAVPPTPTKRSSHDRKTTVESPFATQAKSEAAARQRKGGVDDQAVLRSKSRRKDKSEEEMESFRVEVGEKHGVKPANLMGAIANEAGLDGAHVGRIDIREDHSLIDLPVGMPRRIFRDLQKVWVSGQQLKISRAGTPAKKRK